MKRTPHILVLGWLALAAYYVAVVLLHEEVQQALMPLFHRWSFYGYEMRLIIAWFALGAPVAALVTVGMYRARGWPGLAGWAALLICVSVMDHWFLFSQSERVHYVQYAILYLGLRGLLGRAVPALVVAVALGVGDEAYQAVVLYADRPGTTLDLKDIFLNLLGALIGLCTYTSVAGLANKKLGSPDKK